MNKPYTPPKMLAKYERRQLIKSIVNILPLTIILLIFVILIFK